MTPHIVNPLEPDMAGSCSTSGVASAETRDCAAPFKQHRT
jgi:hypothetical protein